MSAISLQQASKKQWEETDPEAWFREVRARLAHAVLAPYLGPGIIQLAPTTAPTTQGALAEFLGSKVTLPRRARGNLGAAAQYIESHRHRSVVTRLMSEAFAEPVVPLAIHRLFAELSLPLIIDTWYDDAMQSALRGRADWGEIQGARRSGLGGDRYYASYDGSGAACPIELADTWRTVLYKPHGGRAPAGNYLVSDSDYVEVLTEIDIQTPLPEVLKTRRRNLGFLFLGCRFDDQTLRSYAHQILKRSGERHFIVLEPGQATRNETKFVEQHGLIPLVSPLGQALERLTRGD